MATSNDNGMVKRAYVELNPASRAPKTGAPAVAGFIAYAKPNHKAGIFIPFADFTARVREGYVLVPASQKRGRPRAQAVTYKQALAAAQAATVAPASPRKRTSAKVAAADAAEVQPATSTAV